MASPKQPIPPRPVQSQQAAQQAAAQAAFNAKIPQKNTSDVAKQQADQLAAQRAAQAALDAKNRAIQRPVNTLPPPNMSNLRSVAPTLANLIGGNRPQPPMPPRPQPPMPPRPVQPPMPPLPLPRPIVDPMPQPPIGVPPEELYKQYVASYDPGVDQYGMPYDVPSFDQFNFQRNQAQQRDQALLGQMQGVPGFAQPYMQGLGAMAASRAAPRSNPMTGLGAFSANPSIAAANPFAGLGVTAGAQQARQNVQPPYNPGLDDSRMGDTFIGSQRPAANFGQTVGQLFGMGQTMGQPQTQQSPYAQQQSSNLMQQQQNPNLMQNAGQVGQGVYGSFVGQQQQPQPAMQQPGAQQQQNPTQATQGSVAPPMQAGFNFFDQGPTQSQSQNNTGGGTTGGGLF